VDLSAERPHALIAAGAGRRDDDCGQRARHAGVSHLADGCFGGDQERLRARFIATARGLGDQGSEG
jgi:hypothetical protein